MKAKRGGRCIWVGFWVVWGGGGVWCWWGRCGVCWGCWGGLGGGGLFWWVGGGVFVLVFCFWWSFSFFVVLLGVVFVGWFLVLGKRTIRRDRRIKSVHET